MSQSEIVEMYRNGMMFDNPSAVAQGFLKYNGYSDTKPGMTEYFNWNEFGDDVTTQPGEVSITNSDIAQATGIAGHTTAETIDDVARRQYNLYEVPILLLGDPTGKNPYDYINYHTVDQIGGVGLGALAEINAIQDPLPFSSTDYPYLENIARQEGPSKSEFSASYALSLAPPEVKSQYKQNLYLIQESNRVERVNRRRGIMKYPSQAVEIVAVGNPKYEAVISGTTTKEENVKNSSVQLAETNPVVIFSTPPSSGTSYGGVPLGIEATIPGGIGVPRYSTSLYDPDELLSTHSSRRPSYGSVISSISNATNRTASSMPSLYNYRGAIPNNPDISQDESTYGLENLFNSPSATVSISSDSQGASFDLTSPPHTRSGARFGVRRYKGRISAHLYY